MALKVCDRTGNLRQNRFKVAAEVPAASHHSGDDLSQPLYRRASSTCRSPSIDALSVAATLLNLLPLDFPATS